jgi:hypothetical protein
MADTLLDKIAHYRQKLDSAIRVLASPVMSELEPELKKPAYPEDATPVMTHLGTPYMHVWLDNNSTPPQTCMRLRNGFLIRLDQRITQGLAIALLKLPYNTELPVTPSAHEEQPSERDSQVRGQESAGQD